MSPDSSQERTSHSPNTGPPDWITHGHAKLLYPLLTVLNVALLLLLYYYLRRILCGKSPSRSGPGDDSDSGDDSADTSPSASVHNARRLDPEALSALPLFVHAAASDQSEGGGAGAGAANPECAICLGELRHGETGRLLPRCGHRFHAECVDRWFRSHATCPTCRSAAVAAAPVVEPKPLGSDEAV